MGYEGPSVPLPTSTSLIIPAFNTVGTLARVLADLNLLSSAWEILLVDDASEDGTAEQAQTLLPRCRVIRSPARRGAAAARNLGVSQARGEILVFLDSDVQVSAATLECLRCRLIERPELTGIFGAYCLRGYPGEPRLSRFRNLLHSYTHHRHAGPAATFWTGLGVLRRSALPESPFREDLSGSSSVEDVELGYRLFRNGHQLLLDPSFQGTHLKRWTLSSMIQTDIWQRAAVWTELGLRGELPTDRLNLEGRQKLAVLWLCLGWLSLGQGWAGAWICFGLYLAEQSSFLLFVLRHSGPATALCSALWLQLYHFCCCFGSLIGAARYLRRRSARGSSAMHVRQSCASGL